VVHQAGTVGEENEVRFWQSVSVLAYLFDRAANRLIPVKTPTKRLLVRGVQRLVPSFLTAISSRIAVYTSKQICISK
jgi:hypothetical protein